MGNTGILELGLLDVHNQPANDPNTTVQIRRGSDNTIIGEASKLSFPPIRRFSLPAFPQGRNLITDVTPTRYKARNSGFLNLTDGETIRRNLTVLRDPAQWKSNFAPWNLLPASFLPLQDILQTSPGIKVKNGGTIELFSGDGYDAITNAKALMAKAALLNLYAAMTEIKDPISQSSWFSFVRRIILIDRERFIAEVDPKMEQQLRTIKDTLAEFDTFRPSDAQIHFANVEEAMTGNGKVFKTKMFSLKIPIGCGTLQLTIAPCKDSAKNDITILDVDIDENRELLAHFVDIIKHTFSGGTHPFDIHEILHLEIKNLELGYQLV